MDISTHGITSTTARRKKPVDAECFRINPPQRYQDLVSQKKLITLNFTDANADLKPEPRILGTYQIQFEQLGSGIRTSQVGVLVNTSIN
jgi:hypothetical protein